MACTACPVVNVSSVNGRCKNIGSLSGRICSPDQPALAVCLVCARYYHHSFVEVDFLAKQYALSNLLLLDIYGLI
jgi:hypothetical protein